MANHCQKYSLLLDYFFELFSVQVLIQVCMWIVPNAKFTLFNVVVIVINVIVVILCLGLKAQVPPLSLSVLILYGNMEQNGEVAHVCIHPTSMD